MTFDIYPFVVSVRISPTILMNSTFLINVLYKLPASSGNFCCNQQLVNTHLIYIYIYIKRENLVELIEEEAKKKKKENQFYYCKLLDSKKTKLILIAY